MSIVPLHLLLNLLVQLAGAFLGGWGIYLVIQGSRTRGGSAKPSGNWPRGRVLCGFALLLWSFFGHSLVLLAFPAGADEPHSARTGSGFHIMRPDGTDLYVETLGPVDAPPIILTHGWSADSDVWYYAKRRLSGRFRVIVWDLRGLGSSSQPRDRDFDLTRMAGDLEAILEATASHKRAVLVGHSIGGMINLTFCRLFPAEAAHRVAGIVQVDTTYTNPIRTAKSAAISSAIQKPIYEPLLHAIVALSPMVRALNWLSYQNGTAHILTASQSFAGTETRGQLDFVTRYIWKSSPAVIARGALAMVHWDATPVLNRIGVPVLLLEGRQDTTTLPSASEFMRQNLRYSSLVWIDSAAHFGPLEQSGRYDEAIFQFASQCQISPLCGLPAAASPTSVSK